MGNLTIAIAKGRIEKDIYRRLEALNMEKWIDRDSRKLIFTDEENHITYIHVKPSDVVTYVEKGVADLGIVGKDTILENENESEVYELYDLGFGKCKFSVAGMKGKKDKYLTSENLKVATKYPVIAKNFFKSRGQKIDIIKWSKLPEEYISNALSPANVLEVNITDEENKEAVVVVDESQLSLAIGKEGQNVRLAAKLTGWKIDIKSESQAKQDQE